MIERAPENKGFGLKWLPPDKRRPAPAVETPGPDQPPPVVPHEGKLGIPGRKQEKAKPE